MDPIWRAAVGVLVVSLAAGCGREEPEVADPRGMGARDFDTPEVETPAQDVLHPPAPGTDTAAAEG